MKRFIPWYAALLLIISARSGVIYAEANAVSFQEDLSFGIRNDAGVRALQEFLTREGYAVPVTGNYYSLTREAVRQFQIAHGIIPAAGYFGPKTRAAANARGQSGNVPGPTILGRIAALTEQMRIVQEELLRMQAQASSSAPTPTPTPVPTPTPTPALPLPPLDSSLRITVTYPSRTLSTYAYANAILNEFRLSADPGEQIAVTRIVFTNNGTLPNLNLRSLQLVNSGTGAVLARMNAPTDGTIAFAMTPDAAQPDSGVMVSGNTYYIGANIETPNYGTIRTIRLDIASSTDIRAVDYRDLNRSALVTKENMFPLTGPIITMPQ